MVPIEHAAWMDHALVILMAAVLPIVGHRNFTRLKKHLASGKREALLAEYVQTMVHLWVLAAAIAALWTALGRPIESLGLAVHPTPGFWWTLIFTAALCGFLYLQLRSIDRKPLFREKARKQIEGSGLSDLIPQSPAERRAFAGLSLTAGICEEFAYRGFLMAYFSAYMPLAGAIAASSLIFGLGHTYQGVSGMIRTGLFGALLAGLYALSGSIFPVMVIHAANDIAAGIAAKLALQEPNLEEQSGVPSA